MKLKEFSLWGYELGLPLSREFTLFNRSVCAHFERHFIPIETSGVYRVVIKLNELDTRVGTIEESNSVLKFVRDFDFQLFSELNEEKKKRLLLETLHESLIELCGKFDWPKDNFSQAYHQVLEEKFRNIYAAKKKSSPNRKLIAELQCDHNTKSFDCFIDVKDKAGKKVFRKLIFSEEPDEFLFNNRIGDIKWLTNDTLVHLSKDKSEVEKFELLDGRAID